MDLKPPTTIEEQIKKLKERNCIIDDDEKCESILSKVNYYRLSAYFLTCRDEKHSYRSETTFDKVYAIYEFDRKMRGLLFPVIEEIELHLRTQFSYSHAHWYGALGYEDAENFCDRHDPKKFKANRDREIEYNKNSLVVKHHNENYDGKYPLWVLIEFFSFGMLSHFYSDMHIEDRKFLAQSLFGTSEKNLRSWLRCCTDLRNICAHYGRLYYWNFTAIPATPKDFPIQLDSRRLFDNIMVLKFLYPDTAAWRSDFAVSLEALIEQYKDVIVLEHVGFPENWLRLIKE